MINRVLFVSILLLATKVNSQSSFKLSDAISIGLKNNYNIQLAKNYVDIATINNDYGVAGGLPTVLGSANDNEQIQNINQTYTDATKNTKKSNVGTNTLTSNVTGSILLYNGMRVVATKKQLELLQQQSIQQLNDQIQTLIATISTQYYDVIRQQAYLKAINTEIEAAKTKLDIIKKRKDIGLANDADLFQGEIDVNALLQQKDNQELVIKESKINLLSQLILKTDTNLTIQDSIRVDESINIEDIKAAVETNPQIINADEQISIYKWLEKQTAAQRYPSIKATTGYNFNNSKSAAGFSLLNQTYGPFVGFNLSVPIYLSLIHISEPTRPY